MVALVPLAPLAGKAALALSKGAITKAATRSLVSGAAFQAGAELVYQIAEWARSIDGNWDSQDETPGDGVYPENGCWKMESGSAIYEENSRQNPDVLDPPTGAQCNVVSCTASIVERFPDSDSVSVELTRTYTDGTTNTARISRWTDWKWRLNPACGGGVCSSDPYPNPGGEPAGPIDLGPFESEGCNINVSFQGFLANEKGTGNVQPVFLMEPAAELRASGGVIVGDCNFQPTVVVGGGGDGNEPPRTIPAPDWPTASDPWWEYIVEGITGAVLEDIYDSIKEALFGQLEPASFTLVAPCDKTEEGEPETFTVEFPKQAYQDRMEAWQIASAELLQQHLNWKTPTCNEKPELAGEWRTISFRSAETSPYGKSCLRKRFRYRSQSGLGLGEIVDYWRDFTFESGPVVVCHSGSDWGTPQVWAATEDEGKRVIRHAAGEAGIDPDQVGRWTISSSNSARYGVSASMKVDTTGGYYWITARDGSNGRPIVAL
jgi:hypothetical protein